MKRRTKDTKIPRADIQPIPEPIVGSAAVFVKLFTPVFTFVDLAIFNGKRLFIDFTAAFILLLYTKNGKDLGQLSLNMLIEGRNTYIIMNSIGSYIRIRNTKRPRILSFAKTT